MKASKVFVGLLLISALFLLFSSAPLNAKTKISGMMKGTNTMTKDLDMPDVEGHVFQLTASKGTNSGGEMDGAQFENQTFSDLTNGNGKHEGYSTFTKGGDKWMLKFEGHVKTTTADDGTHNMTFEGTFTFLKGEGKYKNIKGGGTYKGKMLGEMEWEGEWEGTYTTE